MSRVKTKRNISCMFWKILTRFDHEQLKYYHAYLFNTVKSYTEARISTKLPFSSSIIILSPKDINLSMRTLTLLILLLGKHLTIVFLAQQPWERCQPCVSTHISFSLSDGTTWTSCIPVLTKFVCPYLWRYTSNWSNMINKMIKYDRELWIPGTGGHRCVHPFWKGEP